MAEVRRHPQKGQNDVCPRGDVIDVTKVRVTYLPTTTIEKESGTMTPRGPRPPGAGGVAGGGGGGDTAGGGGGVGGFFLMVGGVVGASGLLALVLADLGGAVF